MRTRLFFASLLWAAVLSGGVASASAEKAGGPVSALQKLIGEWREKLRAQAQPTSTGGGLATRTPAASQPPAGLGAPAPTEARKTAQ